MNANEIRSLGVLHLIELLDQFTAIDLGEEIIIPCQSFIHMFIIFHSSCTSFRLSL